jgi:hypothetical protein
LAKPSVKQADRTTTPAPPPLRPRARLRVGVTGHRPGRKLPEESIAEVVRSVDAVFRTLTDALPLVVSEARWAFEGGDTELAVVSPLAEGADRIVAEAGLRAGARLEVVLPLTRADYEQDFETEASRAIFRGLLDAAASVFELERSPGPLGRKRGYEAAGLIMLAHADLLIAIWDQGEAEGLGGTANVVAEAVGEGAPVILIDPKAPEDIRLIWTGDQDPPPLQARIEDLPRRDALPLIPELVRTLIAPPSDALAQSDLRAFHEDAAAQRSGDTADRLAARYGRLLRSGSVFTALAAAAAAPLAALGLVAEPRPAIEAVLMLAEIGLVAAILMLWRTATRLRWRERRRNYRRLAGGLRRLGILSRVGARSPIGRPRSGVSGDWVAWYVRAIERLSPPPDRLADAGFLSEVRDAVVAELDGWIERHQAAARRGKTADRRLRGASVFLFATAVTAALGVLAAILTPPSAWPWAEAGRVVALALAAACPALGLALNAVRAQGDFASVGARSAAVAARLARVRDALEAEAPDFPRLADRVRCAALAMGGELA